MSIGWLRSLQALEVAVTAFTVLLQGALLLVAATTVTTLIGLTHSGGGHWGQRNREHTLLYGTQGAGRNDFV